MLITNPNVEHRTADYDLDPETLRGLWRMEERHFWFDVRNRWIERALACYGLGPPGRFLDVGCGSGWVAGALQRCGYSVVGVDTATVLVQKAHQRFPGIDFVAGRIDQLPPDLGPFNGVGFFDVIEHLDDPISLMRSALAHAAPGALVMATVPALRSLFSVVDELAGHKRRYDPGELKAAFIEAGLVDVSEHGIFRVLRPLLRARRVAGVAPTDPAERRRIMLDDFHIPPFPLNGLLRLLCGLEVRLGFGRSRDKAGATLLAVGRKPSVA
ncbi:MAG TPA: class I SAM-dependent methyltransferase [Polyangia bacterium]|nr:class I SAM-dependent methyltransferase [Polyangia bacterium]